jgi:hypothetical protein
MPWLDLVVCEGVSKRIRAGEESVPNWEVSETWSMDSV